MAKKFAMSTMISAPCSARLRAISGMPVEADHEPDPAEIGVDDRASALAEGKPVLIMGGEKLLVVVNGHFAPAVEHNSGIEQPSAGGVPFGDPAGDENVVLARKRGHCGHEGAIGHGLGERAAMVGRIEQIAGVHALRQHHELGALSHRLVHQLRGDFDIVLDIAEPGERLGGSGAETFLLHRISPRRIFGGRQWTISRWKTARQWLLSSTKRASITLSVRRGHGRSISTASATRVGRRVSSKTRLASCTASSRSCETSNVVVFVFKKTRCSCSRMNRVIS